MTQLGTEDEIHAQKLAVNAAEQVYMAAKLRLRRAEEGVHFRNLGVKRGEEAALLRKRSRLPVRSALRHRRLARGDGGAARTCVSVWRAIAWNARGMSAARRCARR